MPQYNTEYHIARLISGFLTETLLPEEEEELTQWVEQSERNRALFEHFKERNRYKKRAKTIHQFDIPKGWELTGRKIETLQRKRKRLRFYRNIAAAIVLLIGISGILFLLKSVNTPSHKSGEMIIASGGQKATLITAGGMKYDITADDQAAGEIIDKLAREIADPKNDAENDSVRNHRIIVPRGGEYKITLWDNTQVWLNSGSELHFPESFAKDRREVTLYGEGYFEVSPNPEAPFIVNTYTDMKVEVLGTSFNLEAYPDDILLETTLASGSVRISHGTQAINLQPEQQAIFNRQKETLTSRTVRSSDYTAWKNGMFIFDNIRLESIMNKLARWYNIEVIYDSETIKNIHLTGDLRRYDDFMQTLNMLKKSRAVDFHVEDRTVYVKEISLNK